MRARHSTVSFRTLARGVAVAAMACSFGCDDRAEPCAPETDWGFCARHKASCGEISSIDLCGLSRTVECGTCEAPAKCGGGGVPNLCGCTAESPLELCASSGTHCRAELVDRCGARRTIDCPAETDRELCAAVARECGALLAADCSGIFREAQCGTCAAPLTCEGGGREGLCGCTSETDADFCTRLGKNCGTLQANDNCDHERTVECGTCREPATCGGAGEPNVCGCAPQPDQFYCDLFEKECGTYETFACGRPQRVECGTCPAPLVCAGSGTPNLCEQCMRPTDWVVCTTAGANCGTLTAVDRCGEQRTVNCGDCWDGFCGSPERPNVCLTGITYCEAAGKNCGIAHVTDTNGAEWAVVCSQEPCPLGTRCSVTNVCEPCVDPAGADLCIRSGADCGVVEAVDACGALRAEDCGGCTPGDACGAGGSPNHCAHCVPETNEALCALNATDCGVLQALDQCEASRTVDCGACPEGLSCGTYDGRNQCRSPVATDCPSRHWCRAQGAQPGGNASLWGSSASDVWLASSSAVFHFDGQAWSEIAQPPAPLMSIWGTGPGQAWGGEFGGRAYRWTGADWADTGSALAFEATPDEVALRGAGGELWMQGVACGWARQGLLRWAGSGWENVINVQNRWARPGMWVAGARDVWLAGDGVLVRHDSGQTRAFPTPGLAPTVPLWGSGSDDVWARLEYDWGALVRWNGVSWTKVQLPVPALVKGACGTGPNDVWFVTPDHALHWDGARLGYEYVGPANLTACWTSAPGEVWAAGTMLMHRAP